MRRLTLAPIINSFFLAAFPEVGPTFRKRLNFPSDLSENEASNLLALPYTQRSLKNKIIGLSPHALLMSTETAQNGLGRRLSVCDPSLISSRDRTRGFENSHHTLVEAATYCESFEGSVLLLSKQSALT